MFFDINSDKFKGVILHNFQNLNLIVFEGLSIAVDEKSEEIEQFRFIEALFRLAVNREAYLFNEFDDVNLIEKHCFVIIMHFL